MRGVTLRHGQTVSRHGARRVAGARRAGTGQQMLAGLISPCRGAVGVAVIGTIPDTVYFVQPSGSTAGMPSSLGDSENRRWNGLGEVRQAVGSHALARRRGPPGESADPVEAGPRDDEGPPPHAAASTPMPTSATATRLARQNRAPARLGLAALRVDADGSSRCWLAGRLMMTLYESRCCKAATQLWFCNTRSGILDR